MECDELHQVIDVIDQWPVEPTLSCGEWVRIPHVLCLHGLVLHGAVVNICAGVFTVWQLIAIVSPEC